jgi:predicted SprT family Zn-dependent metalloprotease
MQRRGEAAGTAVEISSVSERRPVIKAKGSTSPAAPDPIQRLRSHYHQVVDDKFDGILPRDFRIVFNPYLRRLTGRITYSMRLIEISKFHFEKYGMKDAIATLEHELLHLYLHRLGLPSGHNNHFKYYAEKKGIRVYHENAYPRNRPSPYRWLYECPCCRRMVFRKRRVVQSLACGICCREHTDGSWDPRYELKLLHKVRMV